MKPEGSKSSVAMTEMPRYQCHKKVWALKIRSITPQGDPRDGAYIEPADEGYGLVLVDDAYMQKHRPMVGGYYVVYEDGYKSYSPAEPFESGYHLI